MYQKDIGGYNAIDEAFRKNSFFCIKAFVETSLIMTEEREFRNCFDKAMLPMIDKGMDVKELVNSDLLLVPLWKHLSLFSSCGETVFVAYNEDIEELEFEDPNDLFNEHEGHRHLQNQTFGLKMLTKCLPNEPVPPVIKIDLLFKFK